MKNYRDSDYAANKHASGIVYRFADEVVEVTLEDYLRENPDKSSSDFAKLKATSDAMYLNSDRAEYRQTWKNVPTKGFEDDKAFCVMSAETEVIDIPQHEVDEKHKRRLMKSALAKLTEAQRRRYIQNKVDGLSARKIATMEGVNHKSILESLQAAEKKINKFLKIT